MVMSKDLTEMINSGEISIEDFFVMHPYSVRNGVKFTRALIDIEYYSTLYSVTHNTYLRLAQVAQTGKETTRNTVIITGYRGCGKTNFLGYLKAIINGQTVIQNFNELHKNEISRAHSNDALNDISKAHLVDAINSNFSNTISNIKNILHEFPHKSIEETEEELAYYLNNTLRGHCEYINFDEGRKDEERPMEQKLVRFIENLICKFMSEGNLEIILSEMLNFCHLTQSEIKETFEDISPFKLKTLFDFLDSHVSPEHYFVNIEDALAEKLGEFAIDQALFVLSLLLIFEQKSKDQKRPIFLLIDNIDMISDTKNIVFNETIKNIWNFLSEFNSFIEQLKYKTDFDVFVNMFDRMNYILTMRETTSMHIGDHLLGIIESISHSFDLSSDINVIDVVEKRKFFLEQKCKGGTISDSVFLKVKNYVSKITSDNNYYFENTFTLFNNDYKTSIRALGNICKNHEDIIREGTELIALKEHFVRFGGRGIIFRCLFDAFRDWGYFGKIGIPTFVGRRIKNIQADFTLARIMMIYILNLTKSDYYSLFKRRDHSLSIYALYDYSKIFIEGSTERKKIRTFINSLTGMFALRNTYYWTHLITFDNIATYDPESLLNKIEDHVNRELDDEGSEDDALVRITFAGMYYLKSMCNHFEFFASRFCDNTYPLFYSINTEKIPNDDDRSDWRGKYHFEYIIGTIYNEVAKCCQELQRINLLAMEYFNVSDVKSLKNKNYTYAGQFHEERIIHQHISYIDAYRLFLINGKYSTNPKDVNRILVGYIEKYIKLLRWEEEYYGKKSVDLSRKYLECIKHIKESDYSNIEIETSEAYCNKHFTHKK